MTQSSQILHVLLAPKWQYFMRQSPNILSVLLANMWQSLISSLSNTARAPNRLVAIFHEPVIFFTARIPNNLAMFPGES
jgi:hypothetical protein